MTNPAQTTDMIVNFDATSIIAAFDFDGSLGRNCRALGAAIESHLPKLSENYWSYWVNMHQYRELDDPAHLAQAQKRTARYLRDRLFGIEDPAWVKSLVTIITDTCRRNIPLYQVHVASARLQPMILDILAEEKSDDDNYLCLCETASTFAALEMSIMAACYSQYEKMRKAEQQSDYVNQFEDNIGRATHEVADQTALLREQTESSSQMAHGMLDKASEVAAASEQSAIAMREAAQTAAGLIRAIEDARTEVENASEVANRAARQANDSVAATDTLFEQSLSIESILGLIREIAGQTNLLALNATIEAARAGDAGRGFAVVAQEVKSLANQTSQATDEIAQKISAIQNATKMSVESNAAIRDIVDEVRISAERIRGAMEEQARTVTMITASVDETALAADLMSNTISAIRADTENIASEISSLEKGFNQVNEQMDGLQFNAKDFVARLNMA